MRIKTVVGFGAANKKHLFRALRFAARRPAAARKGHLSLATQHLADPSRKVRVTDRHALGFYETAGCVKQNLSRTAGLFLGRIAERHSEQSWCLARIFLQFISGFYTHSARSRFAAQCTLGPDRMKSVLLSQ